VNANDKEDLIAVVKAVLGDVEAIRRSQYQLQLGRGTRSIELRFVMNGSWIVRSILVPLPLDVAALVDDEKANPYNALTADVQPSKLDAWLIVADTPPTKPERTK
jgi:hypothetical protein